MLGLGVPSRHGDASGARASATSLDGRVTAAGEPLDGARVTVFAGARSGSSALAHATTDASGQFEVSYAKPSAGILYLEATPQGASKLRLRSIVGVAGGGGISPRWLSNATINELTTVATTYALAQFAGPSGISGPSPGPRPVDRVIELFGEGLQRVDGGRGRLRAQSWGRLGAAFRRPRCLSRPDETSCIARAGAGA